MAYKGFDLTGKVSLVTGGNGGIGFGMADARRLAMHALVQPPIVVHGLPAGTDLIVGARAGGLNLLLYSVFRIGNATNNVRWSSVQELMQRPEVAWAVPLYITIQSAKLADGNFKPILLVGLDNTTLVGRPPIILQGRLEDVRLPNAIVLDELGIKRLSVGRAKPLGLGDTFELNDKEARIVAICRADRHFFGYPYAYSTYTQALQFAPKQRKMLSLVLAEPAAGWTLAQAVASIEAETGMKAYTEEELFWSTIWWYFRNTGIPIAFMSIIILGFIVGTTISGQTFYAFVHENLRHLGALKAMGASDGLLSRMLLLQALLVGLLGYGIGWKDTRHFRLTFSERSRPGPRGSGRRG